MTTLTPREIGNRKFKQSLMGVDAEEVKSFLKIVAMEFDRLLARNSQLEKKLTEQTVKSTLNSRKEAEIKSSQAIEEADKTAGEILARAGEEADEIRRKVNREAHEKARRETTVMLTQAKLMADEIILSAKKKAEKVEAEARAAADFELFPSVSEGPIAPPESGIAEAEEVLGNLDNLIAEAGARAESIIQCTRSEAEMVANRLIGQTLDVLNREHERLRTAAQTAVREAGAIFSGLKTQTASRKMKPGGDDKTASGGRRSSSKYQ